MWSFLQDNLKVLQSFEKTCTAYKPNIDELEDINQVHSLVACFQNSFMDCSFRPVPILLFVLFYRVYNKPLSLKIPTLNIQWM